MDYRSIDRYKKPPKPQEQQTQRQENSKTQIETEQRLNKEDYTRNRQPSSKLERETKETEMKNN